MLRWPPDPKDISFSYGHRTFSWFFVPLLACVLGRWQYFPGFPRNNGIFPAIIHHLRLAMEAAHITFETFFYFNTNLNQWYAEGEHQDLMIRLFNNIGGQVCEEYGLAMANLSQQQMQHGYIPNHEWISFEANLCTRISLTTRLDAESSILLDNIGYSQHFLRSDLAAIIQSANAHPHPSHRRAAVRIGILTFPLQIHSFKSPTFPVFQFHLYPCLAEFNCTQTSIYPN